MCKSAYLRKLIPGKTYGVNSLHWFKKKITGEKDKRKTEKLPQSDAQDKVAFGYERKWIFSLWYTENSQREWTTSQKRMT